MGDKGNHRLSVRLGKSDYRWLRDRAQELGVTRSDMVRALIRTARERFRPAAIELDDDEALEISHG